MAYLVLQYWPYVAAALFSGILIGWWGEASHRRGQLRVARVVETAGRIAAGGSP